MFLGGLFDEVLVTGVQLYTLTHVHPLNPNSIVTCKQCNTHLFTLLLLVSLGTPSQRLGAHLVCLHLFYIWLTGDNNKYMYLNIYTVNDMDEVRERQLNESRMNDR